MQIYILPHYIYEKIDSSIRSFIWKGASEKGMHKVSWKKITQAKRNGGLGFFLCPTINYAAFRFLSFLLQSSNTILI